MDVILRETHGRWLVIMLGKKTLRKLQSTGMTSTLVMNWLLSSIFTEVRQDYRKIQTSPTARAPRQRERQETRDLMS